MDILKVNNSNFLQDNSLSFLHSRFKVFFIPKPVHTKKKTMKTHTLLWNQWELSTYYWNKFNDWNSNYWWNRNLANSKLVCFYNKYLFDPLWTMVSYLKTSNNYVFMVHIYQYFSWQENINCAFSRQKNNKHISFSCFKTSQVAIFSFGKFFQRGYQNNEENGNFHF